MTSQQKASPDAKEENQVRIPRRGQNEHDGPASPGPLEYARAHVTSPGAHALLDEAGRGRQRQDPQAARPAPKGHKAAAGAFEPLPLDRYLAWLRGYLAAGGKITQFSAHPYPADRLLLATRDFTTGGECGARARDILVPAGIRHLGGGLGHCNLYFDAGSRSRPHAEGRDGPSVTAYSDPGFHELPGYQEARRKAIEDRAEYEKQERARQAEDATRAQASDLSAHIMPGTAR